MSCSTRLSKIRRLMNHSHYPQMGFEDHNCVHLLPIYKTVLKREKAHSKDIKEWTGESVLCLLELHWLNVCADDLDKLVDVTCWYAAVCGSFLVSWFAVNQQPIGDKIPYPSYRRRNLFLNRDEPLIHIYSTVATRVENRHFKSNVCMLLNACMYLKVWRDPVIIPVPQGTKPYDSRLSYQF